MASSLLLARFSSALPLTAPRTAQLKQGSNDKQAKKKKKKIRTWADTYHQCPALKTKPKKLGIRRFPPDLRQLFPICLH